MIEVLILLLYMYANKKKKKRRVWLRKPKYLAHVKIKRIFIYLSIFFSVLDYLDHWMRIDITTVFINY